MKYILFLAVFIIAILNSSCSAIPINAIERVIEFKQLPDLLKENLRQNLNVSGRYSSPLVLNLAPKNVDFRHNQKMKGSFAGDHYFSINKKKFVLNLNGGYNPFVLYEKKIFCLNKPMGNPSIKKLENSRFNVYNLDKHLDY